VERSSFAEAREVTRIVFSSLTTARFREGVDPAGTLQRAFSGAPAIRAIMAEALLNHRGGGRFAGSKDRSPSEAIIHGALSQNIAHLVWYTSSHAERAACGAVVQAVAVGTGRRRPHDRPGGGGIQRGSARLRNRSWDKWVELPRAADWRPHSQR